MAYQVYRFQGPGSVSVCFIIWIFSVTWCVLYMVAQVMVLLIMLLAHQFAFGNISFGNFRDNKGYLLLFLSLDHLFGAAPHLGPALLDFTKAPRAVVKLWPAGLFQLHTICIL